MFSGGKAYLSSSPSSPWQHHRRGADDELGALLVFQEDVAGQSGHAARASVNELDVTLVLRLSSACFLNISTLFTLCLIYIPFNDYNPLNVREITIFQSSL